MPPATTSRRSRRSRRSAATVRLDLPDRSLSLQTDRGVFSADGVDAATKYLLLEAPAPPADGHVRRPRLRLRAHRLHARAPVRPAATVWAVDVNRRALDLCRANAAALGLANVEVLEPDEVPADG